MIPLEPNPFQIIASQLKLYLNYTKWPQLKKRRRLRLHASILPEFRIQKGPKMTAEIFHRQVEDLKMIQKRVEL